MLINKVFDTERDEIVPKGTMERLREALNAIAIGDVSDPQRLTQGVLLNGATTAAGVEFIDGMATSVCDGCDGSGFIVPTKTSTPEPCPSCETPVDYDPKSCAACPICETSENGYGHE